jgi:hypothetical protein
MTVRIRDAVSKIMRVEITGTDGDRICLSIMRGELPAHEVKSNNPKKKVYISDDDKVFGSNSIRIYIWKNDQIILEPEE